MKTYKKNQTMPHNRFYTGFDRNRRKNAQGKDGTTQQEYISKRMAEIRKTEPGYIWMAYIDIPNITKNKIESLEKYVMSILEDEYQSVGNDHFIFKVTKANKYHEYTKFAQRSLDLATEYCHMRKWDYTVKWNKKFLAMCG